MSSDTKIVGERKKAELKWIFETDEILEWQDFEPREYSRSTHFYAEGDEEIKWQIKFYPNGDIYSEEGCITAFLRLDGLPLYNSSLSATGYIRLMEIDEDGEESVMAFAEREFTFDRSRLSRGWYRIAELSDITPSNRLSLICTVQYIKPRTSLPMQPDEQTRTVNQDLQQLLINRSGADICFILEGKEIKAHKAILSARSPVFAAMIDSGMKEAVQNRVEIEDLSADMFEVLLTSIYTDQVDLTKIEVKDLLAAANKYLLPLLKFECQKFLAQRLSNENCSEMLVLSDLHNAVHLKRSTENFIRVHSADVLRTVGWKELEQSHPGLAYNALKNIMMSS